jgi:hypothetical protein
MSLPYENRVLFSIAGFERVPYLTAISKLNLSIDP